MNLSTVYVTGGPVAPERVAAVLAGVVRELQTNGRLPRLAVDGSAELDPLVLEWANARKIPVEQVALRQALRRGVSLVLAFPGTLTLAVADADRHRVPVRRVQPVPYSGHGCFPFLKYRGR